MNMAKIIFDEKSDGIEITDMKSFDQVLDQAHSIALNSLPTIVSVEIHNTLLYVGLGLEQSFIHFMSTNNEPPYFASVGDKNLDGVIDFYLHGSHHTEIQRKNLIPLDKARLIVKTFFQTGIRPDIIAWEEV